MKKKKFLESPSENVILEIADDNLSASITLKSRDSLIFEEEILNLIELAEIKNGFEAAKEYNREHNISKEKDVPFLIAHCPLPKNPKIYYLFNQDNCIDVNNINSVFQLIQYKSVSIGEPVAEVVLTELKQVEQLKNIFGDEINIEELNFSLLSDYISDDVYYSKDSKEILSKKAGYVYLNEDNKISIMSEFHFRESVSDSNLNLKGNIILDGNIDSCTFDVEGDFTVRGHIRNCIDNWNFVNGNLNVESIENSHIACNGNLVFNKGIRFSVLAIDGHVNGGKESSVIGGLIQAGEDIAIDFLGSPFSIITEVEISSSPYSKAKIRDISNQLQDSKKKQSKGLRDKHQKDVELYSQIIADNLDKIVLSADISERKITVGKTIYSDTNLRIYGKSMMVVSEKQSLVFKWNNEDT